MIPEITHVNGTKVVTIPGMGGIATVFVTPETTLKVKGTGFGRDSAIAAIGLNEVNTDTVNISVNNLMIGKTIGDLFELIGGISVDDVLGDVGGSIFGSLGIDLDEVTEKVSMQADILRSPEVRLNSQNELEAYVPSVWEFQTTDLDLFGFKCKYERNMIAMPFAICVYDSPGQHSTPVIIAAVLPLPVAGKPKTTGEKVLIGSVEGPSRDKTDHFGKGGEVRWYEPARLADLFSFNLDNFSIQPEVSDSEVKTLWNWLIGAVSKPGQSVMGEVTEKLAAIRNAGERLTVHEWHNEGVLFDSPRTRLFGTAGAVVIWRDDLPSRPVPILNLGCDCGNKQQHDQIQAMIQAAANKLWSFLPPLHTEKVLLPGQAVTFGLQRLAQGMDNLLVRLLDSEHSGITVKFKFKVTGQNVKISKVSESSAVDIRPDEYSEEVVPGADPESQFQIKILATPDVVAEENPGAEKYITFELLAEISFSSSCVFRDIRIGPAFTFRQLSLKIPTIAVFFTGASCGNVPLIMLPKDTVVLPEDLRGVYWDITGMNPPPLKAGQAFLKAEEIRIKILSKLILLKETVDLVKSVCSFSPVPWIDKLEGILTHLVGSASSVVDTNGKIDNLGQRVYGKDAIGNAESFGRRIESVLLIGPPSSLGGKKLRCYSDVSGRGAELKLEIPDGEWIAAFGNLRNFNEKLSVANSQLPLIKWTQNPAGPPLNWGGAIASIYLE